MDRIDITGIEVLGYHGVMAHERELGQRFVVDLTLDVDLSAAAESDRLEDTVDYGEVAAAAAAIVSGTPARLIETVAGRIADRCLADDRVAAVEVTVRKPAAPVSALVREVSVTLRRRAT